MQPSTGYADQDRTWLDTLPHEVCERIAAHVSTSKNDLPLLNLASMGQKQQLAVSSFLDGKYVEPRHAGCSPYALSSWRRMFINTGVREVDLSNFLDFEESRVPGYIAEDLAYLLNAPTLCKLAITDIEWLLMVLYNSSVVDICLTLRRRGSWRLVMEVLRTLSPKRLSLKFDWCRTECCIAKENQQDLSTVVTSCSRLGHMEIDRFFCGSCLLDFEWSFISQVPSLREVTIGTVRITSNIPLLRRHGATATIHAPVQFIVGSITVEQFPILVTELLQMQLLRTQNFRYFSAYPKLRKLECSVFDGVETVLVNICQTSPLLHTLRIEGQPQHRGFQNMAQGFALRLVEAAPKLVEISFVHIKIPMAELKLVLQSLGSRLETFVISAMLRDEVEGNVLAIILDTIIERNDNLRELHVYDRKVMLRRKIAPNALALLSLLRMRQPLFRLRVSGYRTSAKFAENYVAVHEQNAHVEQVAVPQWSVEAECTEYF